MGGGGGEGGMRGHIQGGGNEIGGYISFQSPPSFLTPIAVVLKVEESITLVIKDQRMNKRHEDNVQINVWSCTSPGGKPLEMIE